MADLQALLRDILLELVEEEKRIARLRRRVELALSGKQRAPRLEGLLGERGGRCKQK